MIEGKKNIKLRFKIGLSLASIFLFLLLPEIILRISHRRWLSEDVYGRFETHARAKDNGSEKVPIDRRDPYLFWKTPKQFEFRSRKHNITKNKNAVRIISLGDSATQGYIREGLHCTKIEETYPYYLEELLNNHGIKSAKYYEVMNAGIGGYSSLQGLRYFKRDLLKYGPDIITVYFGNNDIAPFVIYSDIEQKIFPQWIVDLHNIFMNLKTYQLVVYSQKRHILEDWYRYKEKLRSERQDSRVSLKDFRYNIEALFKIASGKDIRLIIINYPTKTNYLTEYNKVLKDLAIQYRIPFVDIVRVADRYRENKDKIFIDPCHPTHYFNKIIAKEIYKTFLLRKL